jgi:rhamnosyltransferase
MSDGPPTVGRAPVGAVITAFQPQEALVSVCRSVLDQVDVAVVVDDGSPEPRADVLAACRELGAVVVTHPANAGIGAALNTGIERVLNERSAPAYVLTLDQDSDLPDGYVAALVAAAGRAAAAGVRVGMVGPERVEGIGSMVDRAADGVLLGKEPIQSGLLVPTPVLRELGPFAAELFIDGVDSEYYLRARATGRSVVVAPGTELAHRLGSTHVVGGGSGPALTHAAPFRYYYIARNRVILLRRYWRSAPGWCLSAVVRDLRHLAVTTVLVPGRRARWASTLAGLRDGLRGVTGPRPPTS